MIKRLARWITSKLWNTASTSAEGPSRSSRDQDVRKTFQGRDYAGSRNRNYIVHLPASYQSAVGPLPLVMVLHGCHENHETIRRDTRFNSLADREGFIVVYPFITSYNGFRSKNCWGFWLDEHIHKGCGEVQDLAEIIKEVQRDYRVDQDRIHVAGLSSGASMAVALMVAHSELIASGSATAGVPYSETPRSVAMSSDSRGIFKPIDDVVAAMDAEMGDGKRPVPFLIIHSTGGRVVDIQASQNLRDSWGKAFGVNTANPISTESGVTNGTHWSHFRFGEPAGNSVIETLVVEGLPHGWYGNGDGKFAFSNAPNTARLVYEFFRSHPLRPSDAFNNGSHHAALATQYG